MFWKLFFAFLLFFVLLTVALYYFVAEEDEDEQLVSVEDKTLMLFIEENKEFFELVNQSNF